MGSVLCGGISVHAPLLRPPVRVSCAAGPSAVLSLRFLLVASPCGFFPERRRGECQKSFFTPGRSRGKVGMFFLRLLWENVQARCFLLRLGHGAVRASPPRSWAGHARGSARGGRGSALCRAGSAPAATSELSSELPAGRCFTASLCRFAFSQNTPDGANFNMQSGRSWV